MAASSSKPTVEDSIQVALDAADTAAGVTEEFNTIKEQFEVQNIQAKRIYQSITIIFASSIAAALISLTVGFFMYYKALSTLQTNSNMAIESIAIFSDDNFFKTSSKYFPLTAYECAWHIVPLSKCSE